MDEAHYCSTCDHSFHLIKLHKRIVHDNKVETCCECCGRTFTKQNYVNDHRCSGNVDSRECFACGEVDFKSVKKFKLHLESHKELHIFICDLCKSTFSCRDHYTKHLSQHEMWNGMVEMKDNYSPDETATSLNLNSSRTIIEDGGFCLECSSKFPLINEHLAIFHRGKPQLLCEICGQQFYKNKRLSRHMSSHSKTRMKCHVCRKKGFKNSKAFFTHLEEHDCLHVYKCKLCRQTFTLSLNYRRHLRNNHKDNIGCPAVKSGNSKVIKDKIIEVSDFSGSSNIVHNNRGSPEKKSSRNKSGRISRSSTSVEMELNEVSNSAEVSEINLESGTDFDPDVDRTCFVCKKYFSKQILLFNHFIAEHNGNKTVCRTCDRPCKKPIYVYSHAMRHAGRYPWKCKLCAVSLKDNFFYERHMENVHAKRPKYTCDECGAVFIFALTYKAHLLNHDDDSKFKCQHCSKLFIYKQTLKMHLVDGNCELCDVLLPCKTIYSQHFTDVHSLDKSFNCDYCENSFPTKSSLTRHLTVKHFDKSSEKVLYCKLCNYFSNRSSNLTRHHRNHHKTV